MKAPALRLALAPEARFAQRNGSFVVRGDWGEEEPRAQGDAARAAFARMAEVSVVERAAEERVLADGGVEELVRFCFDTTTLLRSGVVHVAVEGDDRDGGGLAPLEPISQDFRSQPEPPSARTALRL